MNFKAFALASSLALGTLFGSVGPAEAGTCWFLKGGQTSTGEWCQVDRRVNANGHVVWDLSDGRETLTVVIWNDNTAELLSDQIPYDMRWVRWYVDRQGDYRFVLPRGEMSFRP